MSVIVAGGVNMDVVAFASRHPKPGETLLGQELRLIPGGKGANQALAAARLGAPTRLVAKVGRDAFGDAALQFLAERGVDLSLVRRVPGVLTGTALIVVAESSENTIVVVPGANDLLSAADVGLVEVQPSDVLVSQFEVSLTTAQRFLALGKQNGALTVLNAAPMRPCSRDLLALADILVVNETELGDLIAGFATGGATPEGLTPREVAEAARRVVFREGQTVVVTLGADGAVAVTADRTVVVPGRKVEAVDTTGAGDCFIGGLAARLAAGDALEAALTFANLAASICVQRAGAGTSMPTADEVAALAGE